MQRNRHIIIRVLICGGLGLTATLAAAEPTVEMLANTCAMCHGTDGKSPGSIDELYGMPAAEFIDEMQEFKTEGEGRIMMPIAKACSDAQIRQMARYFEALARTGGQR